LSKSSAKRASKPGTCRARPHLSKGMRNILAE
jgi:hypothetical protein